MDTIIIPRPQFEKVTVSVTGLLLALLLILMQNLSLSAKSLINITGVSPSIGFIQEQKQIQEYLFNNYINEKYNKYDVIDIEKGVKYVRIIKYYNNRPVRLNIIELSTKVNDEIVIEPSIASSILSSRKKIKTIASDNNAFVAINGGFFKPQTGVPLGTLMIDKEVYTGPIYNRVAMGIFENGYDMARVDIDLKVLTNKGGLKIDNINQPRMLSSDTIVYTPYWGTNSPDSPRYGKQIVIDKGKLIKYSSSSNVIPKTGYVIVGPEKQLDTIVNHKHFKLRLKTSPEWKNVNHIISGGPYLVKDGEIYIDTASQKLTSINGRNPRTAIGYTKDNNLIMLTADGREGASVGLTLSELAHTMRDLGCTNAMNLDGGGSTVMLVNGKIVNKPATQGGIPLSNTVLVKKI